MKSKKSTQSGEPIPKKSTQSGESMSYTTESFEQVAARFQENPIEFKQQFTEPEKLSGKVRSKSLPTRSERWDKIEKLWEDWDKVQKQGGKPGEENSILDKLSELEPKDPNVWYNKGIALTALKKDEEAIKCYDKAIEFDPADPDAWYNKGNALDDLEKYEEAIKCFDKALELGTSKGQLEGHESALAWFNRGHAFSLGFQNFKESLKCYEESIKKNPTLTIAWNNMADSLLNLDRFDEALNTINKALEIDKTVSTCWLTKGQILQKLGRGNEAKECFTREMEIKTMHY